MAGFAVPNTLAQSFANTPEADSHPPIPIHFHLKEPGFVTLVIEDRQGKRLRNLISETAFPAGENIAYWDGLDDLDRDTDSAAHAVYHIPGKLVASGEYRVRGLVRPRIDLHYEMTVYNHGQPPWHTEDRSSEWLANHTPPSAVLFLPENAAPVRAGKPAHGGQIVVGSFVSEGGSGVAWLDLHGNKIHGQLWIGGVWTGATHLARDEGENPAPGVYAYTGSAWHGDQYNGNVGELRLHELLLPAARTNAPRDGRFGTGEDRPILKPAYKLSGLTNAEHAESYPLGGLAVRNGLLVAALRTENKLLFIDAKAQKDLGTAPLEAPRGLAFDKQGRLLVLSGNKLLRFKLESPPLLSSPETLISERAGANGQLEDPQQLALDPEGHIYISDWGNSHQVKVFDSDGKFRRFIGARGKPKAGPYDPNHMNHPCGLTISGDGHLWVAEKDSGPKRLSVWSIEGKLVDAFYGPPMYGGGGELDPRDKTLYHYGGEGAGMTFKLDWKKRSFKLIDVYYRGDDDRSRVANGTFRSQPPQTPLYHEGRKYFTSVFNTNPTGGASVATVWSLENGITIPRAALGRARDWPLLTNEFKSRMPQGMKLDQAIFSWSDLNGNGIAEADEVTVVKSTIGAGVTLTRDLAMVTANGSIYTPAKLTKSGAPIYDLEKPKTLVAGTQNPTSSGGGEVVIGSHGWNVFTTAPKPFAPQSLGGVLNGKALWSYPSPWPGLHASHIAPLPEFPGEVLGTTRVIGFPVVPRGSDAGEIFAINGNKGNIYLFTMDGLFVATLFKDCRSASWNFRAETPEMLLNEASLAEEAFWPFITQTSDGKIYLSAHNACLVRVDGLEKIRRLPESNLSITPAVLESARSWFVESEAIRQKQAGDQLRPLPVMLRQTPPLVDGKLDDWPTNHWVTIDTRTQQNGDWGKKKIKTEAALAISGDKLYAAFQTWDPRLLNNSGDSLPLLFKTGGALDLMLDAIPGGERLLVTQIKGKTVAALYRPKVPGTTTEPIEFTSPLRSIKFDRVDDVSTQVSLAAGTNGTYELSLPLSLLLLKPGAGQRLRGDIGVLRGNGSQTMQRSYWRNKATGLVSDIPSEAELTPHLWGQWEIRSE